MMADDDVIDVIELAKAVLYRLCTPLSGNEEAMGLDMFTDPDRKTSATIRKRQWRIIRSQVRFSWCRVERAHYYSIRSM